MSARLLLVAALHPHFLANGFTIGDIRLFQQRIGIEFGLQFGAQNIQVLFAHPGKNDLMGFSVGADDKSRIFIPQLLQPGHNFFFFAFGLGHNGHRKAGNREFDRIQYHRAGTVAQRIVGGGDNQFGHGADVTGDQLIRRNLLFADHDRQPRDALIFFLEGIVNG